MVFVSSNYSDRHRTVPRYPWYLSDFKDGLNGAVLSSAFFIFFAALAGAITFGGLMSKDDTGERARERERERGEEEKGE